MAYSAQDVTQVVARTLRVPDDYRRFTASGSLAHQLYRIGDGLLAALVDSGLRFRGSGPTARYDELDLANVAISLKLPSPVFLAMHWWPTNLRLAGSKPSTYKVGFRSRCSSGNCHACTKTFAHDLSRCATAFIETPGEPFADALATVRVALEPVALPDYVCELFTKLDGVEWHLLPAALAHDIEFIRTARLADCRLSSYYLYRLGIARKLQVRPAFGIIVSAPFSAFHYWTEFRDADRWLPADPLLFRSLEEWSLLEQGQWPVAMSPTGMLWRLNSRNVPLAWHNGQPAKVTMPTTKLAGDDGVCGLG